MAGTPNPANPGISFPPSRWQEVGGLPCELNVGIAVQDFRVRTMLRLAVGAIVQTEWKLGDDLPLVANGRQIGWVELEALGDNLAIRLTELC
jgi:flagellar motor switch/type III secretory pathway protein FliN